MTDKDLEAIQNKVPGIKKGSSQLFRSLRDKGIISYTEYLFLLSVLTSKKHVIILKIFLMLNHKSFELQNHRVDFV